MGAWSRLAGGFPLQPIQTELKTMGFTPTRPPSFEASTIEAQQKLWTDAGLVEVETRRIDVPRRFASFEDFWGGRDGRTSARLSLRKDAAR
jgi:hypothetical protein